MLIQDIAVEKITQDKELLNKLFRAISEGKPIILIQHLCPELMLVGQISNDIVYP
jgi:hypothetical protein